MYVCVLYIQVDEHILIVVRKHGNPLISVTVRPGTSAAIKKLKELPYIEFLFFVFGFLLQVKTLKFENSLSHHNNYVFKLKAH